MDIATFLIKTPGKAGGFISDFDKVKQGQSFFKSLNCTACHTVGPGSDLIQPEGILGPLPTLIELAGKEDQGCLNQKPTGSWPWFGMDDSQRKALTGALAQVGKPSKSAPEDRIAARMSLLNCYACHSRDGVGGVDKERDAHFLTAEPAMGPEGRLPPHLDPREPNSILHGSGKCWAREPRSAPTCSLACQPMVLLILRVWPMTLLLLTK